MFWRSRLARATRNVLSLAKQGQGQETAEGAHSRHETCLRREILPATITRRFGFAEIASENFSLNRSGALLIGIRITARREKFAVSDKSERPQTAQFTSRTCAVAKVRAIEKILSEQSELEFSRVRENPARIKRTQQRQMAHANGSSIVRRLLTLDRLDVGEFISYSDIIA